MGTRSNLNSLLIGIMTDKANRFVRTIRIRTKQAENTLFPLGYLLVKPTKVWTKHQ